MTPRPTVQWSVLGGYRGSHAHGTNIDPTDDAEFGTDDVDLMHVVVPPPEYYLGLETFGSRGTQETVVGEWDLVAYEARKFVGLLCKGNPNVLSLLWLNDKAGGMYPWLRNATPYGYVPDGCEVPGALLIYYRGRFTHTRRVITAFVGYAYAQLAAMRKDPTHRAYMGERRRALAQRFGYDVKHAAHLLRLTRMVRELVDTGVLVVHRPDAAELVAVKRGEWTLERVLEEADEHLAYVRAREPGLGWPDQVDRAWASRLCAGMVREEWERRGES